MSDFKAKKAPNSISAGAPPETPLRELAALLQTTSMTPSPLSASRASKQLVSPNMYPQIRLWWDVNILLKLTDMYTATIYVGDF